MSENMLCRELVVAMHRGEAALDDLAKAEPAGRRDRVLVLQHVYDLHRGPLQEVGAAVRWQHHPTVAGLKTRLEAEWIEELDSYPAPSPEEDDVAEMVRALAAQNRSPEIYRWIADEADHDAILYFLALEGGPDDLFDDLVATCQIGLPLGAAKMELANNYWDEMGNGEFDRVHNVLYRRFVDAVDLPQIPRDQQPVEALERTALLGLVATNRVLQPEMLGTLGLIELEAGPQCRLVDQGFERLGASDQARAFFQMHAAVDPLHGKGWLENAVGPLVERDPGWGPRILRGAAWKSGVNEAFTGWAGRTLIHANSEPAVSAAASR